ncbi:MAG: FAD-binding oxidoreductase, partial [Pseudomonadota bacterium]
RNDRFTLRNPNVAARAAVVCLGPWSAELVKRFGVKVPLGVKRGYHQDFALPDDARRNDTMLNRLMVDEDNGFVLAPGVDRRNGRPRIRLTTGAEFARLDDPASDVQLHRAEREARKILPLGEPLRKTPWRGARPCLPDLRPVIGRLSPDLGLWANFGHHHLGFTLGPITGRLLAEMMSGEKPFADPSPYSALRF